MKDAEHSMRSSDGYIPDAYAEMFHKLYGPRFCRHCRDIVPVITHKLEGSDYVKSEGMKVTVGFVGSRSCSKCYRPIDEEIK